MKQYTILLVDDNPLLLTDVSKDLETKGYHVITSESGESAIRLFGEKQVDLVITDIGATAIDGIALLQHIKQLHPDTPVIILTGCVDTRSAIDALRYGAEDYLIKPCDPLEMHVRLKQCFSKLELLEKIKRRTSELVAANETLLKEIGERKMIEAALDKHRKQLGALVKEKTENLKDANTALKVLLRKRDDDQIEFEKIMLFKLKELVFPYLEKIKDNSPDETIHNLVNIIEANIDDIISPFSKRMTASYLRMAALEIKVANLVVQGKTTKEIGKLLNLSPRTVDAYRYSIRKKIGINHRTVNLRTYLLSIQ